jgi:murein DD-endopeptidase MepM/ murein hydrolase activator NlpD
MSRHVVVRRPNLSRPLPLARGHFLCLKLAGVSALAAIGVAGCSADISRFDGQGYGLTDNASTKIPSQGMRRGEPTKLGDAGQDSAAPSGGAYYPPPGNNTGNSVRMSSLPEPIVPPSSPPQAAPFQATPQPPRAVSIAPRPTGASVVKAKPIPPGATIVVAPGDTLYGLAKKHAVPVNELMTVNNLTAATIKPGQNLVLPASRSIARAPVPLKPIQRAEPVRVAALPQQNPLSPPPISSPAPVAVAPNATDWQGTHTVKPGESLYGIARANRISFAQLQQVNGITDPTKVKPGSVLKIPGSSTTAALGASAPAPVVVAPIAVTTSKVAGAVASTETPRVIQSATKPVIINQQAPAAPPQQVAALDPAETPNDAAPASETKAAPKTKGTDVATAGGATVSGQKFRWPVKGRLIANYGPRTDSTHNDGINIAVPMGTEVLAAEQGVVAYAGSELKGYGNLILLRHDNGWVTAYAHNEEILVKRGDKVKRGQSIAKAGKTGTVDQPQVHFEIRQGQKPVDPMPHLEKL